MKCIISTYVCFNHRVHIKPTAGLLLNDGTLYEMSIIELQTEKRPLLEIEIKE